MPELGQDLLLQIGSNFANDVYDYEKGADTDARLGPLRVTQAGLLAGLVRATQLVLRPPIERTKARQRPRLADRLRSRSRRACRLRPR